MGSCCFTPRKYNFLWWYWLLLASIVGIPMLLAALYMQRQKRKIEAAGGANSPTEDIEDRLHQAGKKAGRIFWIWTYVFCTAGLIAIPGLEFGQNHTVYLLIWEFFVSLLIANLAIASSRKRKSIWAQVKIRVVALVVAVVANLLAGMASPIFIVYSLYSLLTMDLMDVIPPFADPPRPFIIVLTFACCWFAMHHWRNFIDQPTRRNIWRSIGALVVAAILYCGIERYGNVTHYYVHEVAHLRVPAADTARNYETASTSESHP